MVTQTGRPDSSSAVLVVGSRRARIPWGFRATQEGCPPFEEHGNPRAFASKRGGGRKPPKSSLAVLALLALSVAACNNNQGFKVTTLVADEPSGGTSIRQDTNLVNPWGVAIGADTYVWVANNGTNTMTVYDGAGVPQPSGTPTIVSLPSGTGGTGLVFNTTSGFEVGEAGRMAPSQLITVSEAGTILGFNATVDSKAAIPAVDHSAAGAVYKGATLARNGSAGVLLYATDFAHNRVDVFDQGFLAVDLGPDAFVDPDMPANYAPFGIRTLNGELYVTYALQDSSKHDDVAGAGNGYLDVYGADGSLIRRLVQAGPLNAPWGLALAPDGFGVPTGTLLVGNFGDGRINSFNPNTGQYFGALQTPSGSDLQIPGLWSIAFGNDGKAGPTSQLLFTSGPSDEGHGRFGTVLFQSS